MKQKLPFTHGSVPYVINSCLDFIKAKQSISGTGELERAEQRTCAACCYFQNVSQSHTRLVRELPPATQAVFNLYVMEGYSHAEIGKLTGTSEGTSKWHLSEARKKLQKMINEQNN